MSIQFISPRILSLLLATAISLSGLMVTARASAPAKTAGSDETQTAPANDNFANAQVISGATGTVNATNVGATKEADEPAHANNRGGTSIWFKYIAPGNGVLTLDTFGSNFNSLLAVYKGTALANLRSIVSNDNYTIATVSSIDSLVNLGTQTGDIFYLAVDGYSASGGAAAAGNVTLHYQFTNAMSNDGFVAGATALSLSSVSATNTITATNVGASKEIGEPDHAGNPGGRSIWFKWTNSSDFVRTYSFALDSRLLSSVNSGVNTLFAIYTGTDLANLAPVVSRNFLGHGRLVFQAAPHTDYYLALDGYNDGTGAATGDFTMTYGIYKDKKIPDFDHDGTADLAVYRPSTGVWYSQDTGTGNLRSVVFGANGDKPLFADFDSDDETDNGVFRPDIGGWYLNGSHTPVEYFNWGLGTDIPLITVDYNQGSIYSYVTVFRPTTGIWYLAYGIGGTSYPFGTNGDIPVTADFNGDAADELAVFRPSNGTWYILNTATNQVQTVQFGQNGDKPVVADYDGDGRADIAVFRPSTGAWYILYSSDGSFHALQWGVAGDKPQPADYDSDGSADVTVYRNGVWYIRQSSNGALRAVQFGLGTDIPVSSPVR